MLYVDTSAFLKLLIDEPHSAALRSSLASAALYSSTLLSVEAHRAARRLGLTAQVVEATLGSVALVTPSSTTFAAARTVGPADLRTLDALHLASARELGPALQGMVTYDRRLAGGCAEERLTVVAPGLPPAWWN